MGVKMRVLVIGWLLLLSMDTVVNAASSAVAEVAQFWKKDNVFDLHVQARKGSKGSKTSKMSKRKKSSKGPKSGSRSGSAGESRSKSVRMSSGTRTMSESRSEGTMSESRSEGKSESESEGKSEGRSSADLPESRATGDDKEPSTASSSSEESDESDPSTSPPKDVNAENATGLDDGTPTTSPTCVDCDEAGAEKKAEVWLVDEDALVLNIDTAPPSSAPTCVECDDGPPPNQPPTEVTFPKQHPSPSRDADDMQIDAETDGDKDPFEDGLLHAFHPGDTSGSNCSEAGTLTLACCIVWLPSHGTFS